MDRLLEILDEAEEIAKKAKRHGQTLAGSGFYAKKFSKAHADAVLATEQLSQNFKRSDDQKLKAAIDKIVIDVESYFTINNGNGTVLRSKSKKEIAFLFQTVIIPATESDNSPHALTNDLFPFDIIKGTRGYLEKVAEQACGAFDKGWYDAAAVMVRRLLEVLIIESFEAHGLTSKIQKPDGTFFYLQDLVNLTLQEKTWTLGRNVKKALPSLKDIGNQSAHGRRYLARKSDLENIERDLRLTIEELVILSKFK